MRKQLATELATGDVEVIYRRAWFGHEKERDVHHKHYVEFGPESLRDVFADIARLIDDELGGDLRTDTQKRPQFGVQHPLRARSDYSEDVLVESGWLTPPADAHDDLLTTTEVAELLDIGVTTARRQMKSGQIPASLHPDPSGGERHMARRSDVERVRKQRQAAPDLRRCADELGLSYHEAWQLLRHLYPAVVGTGDRRLNITDAQLDHLRAEHGRLTALRIRSMRLSEAARLIRVGERTMRRHLQAGEVDIDPETDHHNITYVTRASVQRFAARRQGAVAINLDDDTLTLAQAASLTGLTKQQLNALAKAGLIDRIAAGRSVVIPTASLRSWAAGHRPDLLESLGQAYQGEASSVDGGT